MINNGCIFKNRFVNYSIYWLGALIQNIQASIPFNGSIYCLISPFCHKYFHGFLGLFFFLLFQSKLFFHLPYQQIYFRFAFQHESAHKSPFDFSNLFLEVQSPKCEFCVKELKNWITSEIYFDERDSSTEKIGPEWIIIIFLLRKVLASEILEILLR